MKSDMRNEIKAYIVRQGMTMQEVVDVLSDVYGWSDSVLSSLLMRWAMTFSGSGAGLTDSTDYELWRYLIEQF